MTSLRSGNNNGQKWYQSTIGAFPTRRCNGGHEPAEVDDEVELSEDAGTEGLKLLTWFRFLGMPGPSLTAVCNNRKHTSRDQNHVRRCSCLMQNRLEYMYWANGGRR